MPDPKDVLADSSSADTKTQDADDVSLDQKDDEKEPDGPLHKSVRWKEVYGKYKEYKDLGDPSDVSAKLARLEYYDSLVANLDDERPKSEPKTDEQKVAEKELADARAALKQVAPEFEAIKPMAANMRSYYESLESGAEDETERLMDEAGMPTTPSDKKAMAEILQSFIKEDRKKHLLYLRNPEKAVEWAFERFTKDFVAGRTRKDAASAQRDKEKLSKLPKPLASAGSIPSEGKSKAPTNLKEADIAAKEFLKQYTG